MVPPNLETVPIIPLPQIAPQTNAVKALLGVANGINYDNVTTKQVLVCVYTIYINITPNTLKKDTTMTKSHDVSLLI